MTKKHYAKITGMRRDITAKESNTQPAKRRRFEEMVKLIKPKGDDHATEAGGQ